MCEERKWITPEQAIELLYNDVQNVHTYRNAGFMLIGCDWLKENIIKLINEHPDDLEIGGTMCRKTGHGLVLWDSGSPLFIEADRQKVDIIDPL